VVAEVNGVTITRAELDEEAASRLARLRQEEYQIRRETLEGMIEAVAGPLAADGGNFGPDIFGNLPELRWGDLTKTFLRT
jgi:thioester reductase-like protein